MCTRGADDGHEVRAERTNAEHIRRRRHQRQRIPRRALGVLRPAKHDQNLLRAV